MKLRYDAMLVFHDKRVVCITDYEQRVITRFTGRKRFQLKFKAVSESEGTDASRFKRTHGIKSLPGFCVIDIYARTESHVIYKIRQRTVEIAV